MRFLNRLSRCVHTLPHTKHIHEKVTMCCVFKWASYLAPNVQSLCVVALHNSSFSSYCYYCFKIIFVRSFVSHTYHKSTYILLCLTNKKNLHSNVIYESGIIWISVCAIWSIWIYLPNKELFQHLFSTCFKRPANAPNSLKQQHFFEFANALMRI